MNQYVEPQMVDALYQGRPGQGVAAEALYSSTFGPDNRRLKLGDVAPGELIRVPIVDVVANPALFLAPCGKPYIVSGSGLENPCTDDIPMPGSPEALEADFAAMNAPVAIEEAEAELTELFGTAKAAKALIEGGYATKASIGLLMEDELEQLVGARAMARYRKVTAEAEGGEAEVSE